MTEEIKRKEKKTYILDERLFTGETGASHSNRTNVQGALTPDERRQKPIEEKTFPAHSRIAKSRVNLRVKSVEKSACDQIRWPNCDNQSFSK